MLKRIFQVIVGLAVLGTLYLVILAPAHFDAMTNRVKRDVPLPAGSEQALVLHESLFIADLHADPLLWRRDLSRRHERGMVDLPRLLAGIVGLQVFGSVTMTPANQNYDSNPSDSDVLTALVIGNLQPVATWTSLYERSRYHARKLRALQPGRRG